MPELRLGFARRLGPGQAAGSVVADAAHLFLERRDIGCRPRAAPHLQFGNAATIAVGFRSRGSTYIASRAMAGP